MRSNFRVAIAAGFALQPTLTSAATDVSAAPPVSISRRTLQMLGDSKVVQASSYNPAPGGANAGGVKSLAVPATWVEAALRGVTFDMTIAPPVTQPAVGPGEVIGLKQLRDYAGRDCVSATASVAGANGFSARAEIAHGAIVGWTVTSPQTGGRNAQTYAGVTIKAVGCKGALYATPVLGGYGTFGASGQTLLEMRERAADICQGKYGAKPGVVEIMGGDNDLSRSGRLSGWSGDKLAITGTILAQRMMDIVRDLAACGITAQVIGHPARGAGALTHAGFTPAQTRLFKTTLAEMNVALKRAAGGDPALNPTGVGFLFCDDYLRDYSDNGTATGDPLADLTPDQTHPNQWGAAVIGYWAAKQLLPYMQAAARLSESRPLGRYDKARNPAGDMAPDWRGPPSPASGAFSGASPSGTETSVGGGVAPAPGSIVVATTVPPRREAAAAPSFSETFHVAAATGSDAPNVNVVSLRSFPPIPAGVAAGAYVEAACDVEYSSLNNVIALSVGVEDVTNKLLYHTNGKTAGYLPRGADLRVGAAGPSGWFGWPLRFHSAPMRVLPNTAQWRLQDDVYIDASAKPKSLATGGVVGVTGAVKLQNCTLEPYAPAAM